MSEWRTKLGKAVRIVSEAAEVAVLASSNPGIVGITAIAAKALNSFNEMTSQGASQYFRRGWVHQNVGFSSVLLKLAKDAGFVREVTTAHDKGMGGTVWVGEVHGVEVGWTAYETWCEGPYFRHDVDASPILGRLVWEHIGKSVKLEASINGDRLLSDLLIDAIPSKRGDALYEKLKRYNDRGYTRSMLLLGLPGTGKSNLMRYIAQRAGGFTLRIRAKSLRNLADIPHAIELLRPSAVLIDDLDRLEAPDQILSEIEEIKHTAKILICSVNDVTKLDPAVLRAGRFDEREEIDQLDAEIQDHLIGDVPTEVAAALRKLPVTWLNEFHITREVEGIDVALAKVTTMAARHDEIVAMMGGSEGPAEPPSKPASR